MEYHPLISASIDNLLFQLKKLLLMVDLLLMVSALLINIHSHFSYTLYSLSFTLCELPSLVMAGGNHRTTNVVVIIKT